MLIRKITLRAAGAGLAAIISLAAQPLRAQASSESKEIEELKRDYTIVIVTHNMQQAARVSDETAFMYMGELIEFGDTEKIFTKPNKKQTEDYITGRFG